MNYCKCKCGQIVSKNWVKGHHRKGSTFNMPEDAKEKIRRSHTGNKNGMFGKPSWNKGKTGIYSEEQIQKIKIARAKQVFNTESLKKLSESLKKAYSEGRRITVVLKGDKNPRWISDRTKLKKSDRQCGSAYTEWRNLVFKRDGFKCRILNSDCDGRIEAHHILSWKDHPELRYVVNNGITVCHKHHPRGFAEKKMSPYFQELVETQT